MPRYVFFFSHTSDTRAQMTGPPGHRTAVVRRVVEAPHGSLESLDWMLGRHGGIAIAQLPDADHAAALSAMITSTGALRTVQDHQLLTQEQLARTPQLASDAGQAFQRPGQP
jgi:uncharacterized protein with GYD domain